MQPFEKGDLTMAFMAKALRSKAASLLLPVSLLVAGQACAGQDTAAAKAPAPAAVSATAEPSSVPAKKAEEKKTPGLERGLHPLKLEEVADQKAFLEKYPFAKESVDTLSEWAPVSLSYARVKDADTKLDALFVYAEGGCGTLGCSFMIFVRDGDSFRKSNHVVVPSGIRTLKNDKDLSLVFETHTGQAEWAFNGKGFRHKGPYRPGPPPAKTSAP